MENYFQVTQVIKKNNESQKNSKNNFWSQSHNFLQNSDFVINKSQALKLENVVLHSEGFEKNIMNLFIHGGKGCGKYTLARFYIYLYTDIPNPCLNLETIKYEGKELEYYRGAKHCELVLYKYNFNDINLIHSFFTTVCHDNHNNISISKKIIIIKNIENVRKENLYIIKFYVEKYSCNNAFIFTSCINIPQELLGFLTNIRVSLPTERELYELGKKLLKDNEIKYNGSEIKKIAKQSKRNMNNFINLLELSYLSGKYHEIKDSQDSKFLFLYKLLKKKNLKTILMIREILTDLITENIKSQEIAVYLLNRFLKSKNITEEQKGNITDILVKTDLQDIKSFRNIIHLEHACIQIINVL